MNFIKEKRTTDGRPYIHLRNFTPYKYNMAFGKNSIMLRRSVLRTPAKDRKKASVKEAFFLL